MNIIRERHATERRQAEDAEAEARQAETADEERGWWATVNKEPASRAGAVRAYIEALVKEHVEQQQLLETEEGELRTLISVEADEALVREVKVSDVPKLEPSEEVVMKGVVPLLVGPDNAGAEPRAIVAAGVASLPTSTKRGCWSAAQTLGYFRRPRHF